MHPLKKLRRRKNNRSWYLKASGVLVFLLLFTCSNWIAYSAETIWSGKNSKAVALTFDDGPHPEYTAKLLDILDRYQAKATFFVIGRHVKSFPDLVFRMQQSGHEIGNHSFRHERMNKMKLAEMIEEIEKTNLEIKNITGREPRYFRAPGGQYSAGVYQGALKTNMQVINWSLNAGDYQNELVYSGEKTPFNQSAQEILKHLSKMIKGGDIVLMHNGAPQTLEALPQLIEMLHKKGLKLVTVSEILKR
jgi:peptidoglycan/xylan/chitin deacetylase (PgdA/CDA1 family)